MTASAIRPRPKAVSIAWNRRSVANLGLSAACGTHPPSNPARLRSTARTCCTISAGAIRIDMATSIKTEAAKPGISARVRPRSRRCAAMPMTLGPSSIRNTSATNVVCETAG